MTKTIASTALFLSFGLPLLGSCGDPDSVTFADATFAMTDAATDELEVFEVDIENIVLSRLGGSSVSVMASKTRVDFASLESLSELLIGARIPVGVYTRMTMTLGFSTAAVCLIGQTTPATILDPVGSPITGDVTVDVTFASGSLPQIVVGRNHLFLLDLDLNHSITVDAAMNQVTFSPVATAEVNPNNPKPIITSGILTAVSINANELTVERRTVTNTLLGRYTVTVTGSTIYQIDGVNSIGGSGLTALATMVSGLPRIFVQGALSGSNRTLTAVAIETGRGTPGNGQDLVIGHIIGRDNGAGSNATLTVLGFSTDYPSGVRRFNTAHSVSVDLSLTKVLRRLNGIGLTTDNLNVGQRIAAFGTLSGNSLDASAQGIVRLFDTSVWGTANSAPAGGTLSLNLTRIGPRPIAAFNFTVGGISQADPTSYDVTVASLQTNGVTTGTKIRAIGIVNPVDVTTDDDFTASSFVNHSTTASLLLCQWFPANTAALTATANEITLDVSTALIKAVGNGFGTTVLTTTPTPTIRPLLGAGIYRIVENGAIELHFDFASFSQSLTNRISVQSSVFRVGALGTFDETTQVFDALVVSVVLL